MNFSSIAKPLTLLLAFGAKVAVAQTSTLPTFECSSTAYLVQGNDAFSVDLASGSSSEVATNFWGSEVNAIGYNTMDNYIYGISGGKVLRIGSDFSVENLGTPTGWTSPGGLVGDITASGQYFVSGTGSSSSMPWNQVDLDPSSATYMDVVASGTATKPNADFYARDWAYNTTDGKIYAVATKAGTATRHLWVFDPEAHSLTEGPAIGSFGASGSSMGAAYCDADGNLYVGENGNGDIWKINVQTGEKELFSTGPTSSDNDGAMCAEAQVLPKATDDLSEGNTLGDPVTVSALDNDENGDPATLSFVCPDGATCTDTDGDGDTDNAVVPGEGTWTVNEEGQVTFTPEEGFNKNPTPIDYTIKDASGHESEPATITIKYEGALPVTFGSISAALKDGQLLVDWETHSETNCKGYDVQVSKDGKTWESIGFVQSKSENGYSSEDLRYSFSTSWPAAALGGLSLLAFGFLPFRNRRVRAAAGLLLLLVAGSTIYSCKKSYTGVDYIKGETIFVRVMQHDIDGGIQYSKIVKVVPR